MINFFTNTHEIDTFDFELERKVRVTGKLTERWIQLLSRSIACGEDKKRIIEKKIGISKTEREDLESVLKGSVGVKGIASIESQIKAKTGIEVKLEYATTETEETTFKAPECGRKTLIVYQLVREYDITITDKRILSFSRGQTRIMLTEYTDNFHDKSLINNNDPDCGCKDKTEDPDDGIFSLLINKYYQLVTPYKISQQKLTLKNLEIEVSVEDLGNIVLDKFQINSALLPSYIQFFAGIKTEQVYIGLNTDGNIAFDYEEKVKFNQNLSSYAYAGDVVAGATLAMGYPVRRGYGYPVFDPNDPFFPGVDPGQGVVVVPGIASPFRRRFFGQEGESKTSE
jgi:hypothetical protein